MLDQLSAKANPKHPLPLSRQQEVLGNPTGGTETILVAEDESTVRVLVETILTMYGYHVLLAEDGDDCVEKFLAHRDRVSLIIMDMIMPKLSGLEAYRKISLLQPEVKVLYFSGYNSDFINSQGLNPADMNVVTKPVRLQELLRAVREILDA